MKIRTITIDEYDAICKKSIEAAESVRGCRNKVKVYSETMIRECTKANLYDMNALELSHGIVLIHYKNENLGTNRWGDWYKQIYVTGLECDIICKETPSYLVTLSGERYYKDHILAVVI